MRSELPCTPESILAAKLACQVERQQVTQATGIVLPAVNDLDLEVGLKLGNLIAAACYGPRGEKRN